MRPGPNGEGLSRKAILGEIDNSLRRLGTDFVDLYEIHRWDPTTPIEETMEALHDVVKAGKARYIGASNHVCLAILQGDLHLPPRMAGREFVSMQNHVNLLNREEEREMLPLCIDQGIAVIPWSPLAAWPSDPAPGARPALARKPINSARRSYTEFRGIRPAGRGQGRGKVAEARGVPRAQVALAWVLQKQGITAPIVGASKPHHLTDAVAALSLGLTTEEIAALEAPYVPHHVTP